MSSRTYRLRITAERTPDVFRVLDFDGRHTLHDVHQVIQREFDLDDDHPYAFFLSGQYWDPSTEVIGPGVHGSGPRAERALLFRLGLLPGKSIAYLFDFGDELRHSVEVVAVTESNSPLRSPVLVESVGDAPPQSSSSEEEFDQLGDDDDDGDGGEDVDPSLAEFVPRCETIAKLVESESGERVAPSNLMEARRLVTELARDLGADPDRFFALDASMDWDLHDTLLDLPFALAATELVDEAAETCLVMSFADPETFLADRAIILARANRIEAALQQVAANLEAMGTDPWVRMKAGDVYDVQGDFRRAEELYREALALAKQPWDRESAVERLAAILGAQGRTADAAALLASEGIRRTRDTDQSETMLRAASPRPSVGRNEPCPCGSGKKYKKCCG
jgi:hypothetical protein